MIVEQVDRRIVAAVRLIDAVTDLPVGQPLRVEAEGVRWVRNLSGDYVMVDAPGFTEYTAAFERPPPEPAPFSRTLELIVHDPEHRYLARRSMLRLPRDPDPEHADQPDSLFRAAEVRLFRSPAAPIAGGWAVIRGTVRGTEPHERLGGALIRVIRTSDEQLLSSGLSDRRGEALIAVPGIPVTTWEEEPGPVLTTEVEVRLEVVFDPENGELPDPDDLEARHAELLVRSRTATLAAGRVLRLEL